MFTDTGDAAVERHMIACVNESLSLYLMSNARFMCERLVAEFPSEVQQAQPCMASARLSRCPLKTRDCCAQC